MSDSRLTKKERKSKSLSARRGIALKNQSFKPVLRSVDIEKIKQEFKANAKKGGGPANAGEKATEKA